MKKTLTVLASAVLALSMLFVMGCKKDTDLDMGKVKAWGKRNLNGESYVIQINADKDDIDSWFITETNGVLLDDSNFKKIVSGPIKKADDPDAPIVSDANLAYKGSVLNGNAIKVTFDAAKLPASKDVVVWVESNKKEGSEGGNKIFRGRVQASTQTGRSIKLSGVPEITPAVGFVKVTCNETAGTKETKGQQVKINKTTCYRGSWGGNYKITEIWPFEFNTEKNKYVAVSGLKFTGLNIEEGHNLTIVYPAGVKSLFALKQPERFKPAESEAAGTQVNYYWCQELTLDKGQEKQMNSNSCKGYVNIADNSYVPDSSRASDYSVFTFDESEIKDGADIK